LRAACPNAIIAHPMGIIQGIDHLFTGKVERWTQNYCRTLLAQGIVPVVPPLDLTATAKPIASIRTAWPVAIADALKATKLIFIHDPRRDNETRPIDSPTAGCGSGTLLSNNRSEILPEVLSKAIHASRRAKPVCNESHIINGRVDEGLLAEVFSNEGIGTLIYANEYQQIRRALKKDVRHLLMLTKESVASEELVKRTRSTIEKNVEIITCSKLTRIRSLASRCMSIRSREKVS